MALGDGHSRLQRVSDTLRIYVLLSIIKNKTEDFDNIKNAYAQ